MCNFFSDTLNRFNFSSSFLEFSLQTSHHRSLCNVNKSHMLQPISALLHRDQVHKENVYHNQTSRCRSENITLQRESLDFILTEKIFLQNKSKIYFTEETRRISSVYNFQEKYSQFKMIANTFRLIKTA